MCSVGDSFNIDIAEGIKTSEYECGDCRRKFKGVGKNVRCPECDSKNTIMI